MTEPATKPPDTAGLSAGDAPTAQRDRWFVGLLAATAMGVYLLVIAGATAAVSEAVAACSTWPTCEGAVLADSRLAIAWGHRIAAVVVGVAVLATAVLAWRTDTTRRVRATVTLAVALYPVQVGVGALTATSGGSALSSGLHLAVGLSIFGALVLAVAWALERETATPDDRRPVAEQVDPVTEVPAEEGSPRSIPEDPVARAKLTALAYLRLTKPRLMWLLCLVALAAMALAAGSTLDPAVAGATLLGGVLAIGASGTFNHVLERDRDRKMDRTADRPLAVDLVPARNAVAFGVVLGVASLAVFAWVNLLTAVLGLTAIVFYSVVYTLLLKPNTVQNTVIGGAAGALPALIGWAAVTGEVGAPAIALAGVIFLWTPAHFYNLALAYKEDYARGGFPMMPVVHGEVETRKQICWYFGATLAAAVLLAALTGLGPLYAATSALLGAVFLAAIVHLHRERTESAALRSFMASNAYLGAVLLAVVVDAALV